MRNILSALSGVLFLAAFVPYISAIWHDRYKNPDDPTAAKPAKTSWLLWMVLDLISLIGMWSAGTLNYQIVAAVIGAGTVAGLAIRFGKPGWTHLDIFCVMFAVIGIILWQVYESPTIAIVASNSAVFVAAFPTFQKGWEAPESEDKTAWTLYWLSCVCAVAAIPHFTLADATQPLTFFCIESVMMFLVWVRPRFLRP